jgi:hypothetical protein
VIPKLFNLDKPSNLPPRKALFAHTVDLKRSLSDEPNRITIVVHAPGVWIWIIPFSNGITSLGYVGDPEFFEKYEGSPEKQFRALIESEPYLRERFKDVELVFEPRVLQSWSTTTNRFFGDGFVLTGNVTEFLDPVFSSGVTLPRSQARSWRVWSSATHGKDRLGVRIQTSHDAGRGQFPIICYNLV